MSIIKYRPEVDGLRALAILPVLIFHLNPRWMPGGFMGVDVFFVISGYLITSIILAELDANVFSMKAFWERRLRRIFPALAVMLGLVLVGAVILLLTPRLLVSLGKQVLAVLGLVSNYGMLHASNDYWNSNGNLVPLLHTWSLAVEEQFYLFLPILLFGLFRSGRRSWTLPVLSMLAGISFIYCLVLTPVNQSQAFYLLPTRAWELLAGSVLATITLSVYSRISGSVSRWLADAGLVAVVLGYVLIDDGGFPGWKPLIPVLGAGFFICFSHSGCFAKDILSKPPIVFIGKASYSLYLWHWPAIVFGKLMSDIFEAPQIQWWFFFASLLIALASHRWVEKFGKQMRHAWGYCAVAGLVLALLVFGVSFVAKNAARQFNTKGFNDIVDYDALERSRGIRARHAPQDSAIVNQRVYDRFSVAVNPTKKVEIVVLGDSHAMQWGRVLERIADEQDVSAVFWTSSGISPTLENEEVLNFIDSKNRTAFNLKKLECVKNTQPAIVVVAARWDALMASGKLENIDTLVAEIRKISTNSKVVILLQPPLLNFGNQYADDWLTWRARFRQSTDSTLAADTANWEEARQYLKGLSLRFTNVQAIEVADLYSLPNRRIKLTENGRSIYLDDDHLSEFGVSLAAPRIKSIIAPLLDGPK